MKRIITQYNSLPEAMDYHHLRTPNKVAVVMVNDMNDTSKNRHLSYADLRTSALSLALQLQEMLPANSRILLPTVVSEYFVVAFLACSYANMVAVPTPRPNQFSHQRQRLSNIVTDAGIAAVCHAPSDHEDLEQWCRAESEVLVLVEVAILNGTREVASIKVLPSPSDLALLQYTSGSTGDPKGVIITHANLHHNATIFQHTLGYDDDTIFGGWIPQYHDMGLMAQVLPSLFLGSSCYMMTPTQFVRRPLFWLKMLAKYRINHTCAPNFAFALCQQRVSKAELNMLDLSCVRYLINGSEPIQADTIREFSEAFADAGFTAESMQPCYGMAECTVFISGASPRKPKTLRANREALKAHRFKTETNVAQGQLLVSCGFFQGYKLRIVGPDEHPLADGKIGEVWLQGGSVAQGYWNKQHATASTFHAYLGTGEGPFLKTGDLGFVWQKELFITGRCKEVIIVNGKNLYPQDIEHGLRQQFPELSRKFGAAFGLMQENGGESIGICHEIQAVYANDALQSLSVNIRSWVSREWGAPVSSVSLLHSGDIDRTTSGKIQRAKVKERFLAQTLRIRHQWVALNILRSAKERPRSTEAELAS